MYLNTFGITTLSVLLLITPIHCIRTASSPKYLFSNEANILDDEGAFVGSQDPNERFKRYSNEDVQPNSGRSRSRRADGSSQEPIVKASQELCEHEQLVIQWTSTRDRVTSNGNIVALCRGGKNGKSRAPLVFVSYDHGLKWNNVTTLFTNADNSSALSIEKYYAVNEKPNFIIFPDGENKRIFYTNDGLKTVNVVKGLPFMPEDISINPDNPLLVIASNGRNIYLSKDGSKTYNLVKHFNEVNAYYWGMKIYGDKETDIFAEGRVSGNHKTQGYKVDCSGTRCVAPQPLTDKAPLNGDITDFLVKNEYMFCTKQRDDKNGVDLYVKYLRSGNFVKAKIITPRPIRELFVYDVSGGVVMIVANLRKNETNLYTSLNISGIEYSLSLPRVLYHNPHTDVSSHWLRQAVSYRFVDVLQVKSLPSVYFATQLTIGPVGGRYLISVVTFDKGGVWKPIQGPLKNKYGNQCLYPRCSLHINLFYGSIYRYSRTTPLMSRKSAPGLIMTTGVLGANLKITPDTYISRDGGNSFEMVLRGKRHFAFGDHGGFVVASHFTQSKYLQYSYDFKKFYDVEMLSTDQIQIKKILTEPGEMGVVFLVMGTVRGNWRVFQVNATKTLGPICTNKDFIMVNVSDVGVGGCTITTVKQRNASSHCLTGRNYGQVMTKSYEKCFCRRLDYICDYKFKPSSIGGCELIEGAKLPTPNYCPEGSFYYQTQGYVKIRGRKCTDDNVTQSSFNPKKTPCPDSLDGLVITAGYVQINGSITVALNTVLNFTATLNKGNLLRAMFDWRLNGKETKARKTGAGKNSFSYKMTEAGTIPLSLKVSNDLNSIRDSMLVSVQRKIEKAMIIVKYSPTLPSVDENVTFYATFSSKSKRSEMGLVHFKWIINSIHHPIKTNNPELVTTFDKTGKQTVAVNIYNKVSHAIQTITVMVTSDLKVKNVKLSNRDGLIVVQWDAVVEPLYNVRGYKVRYRKVNGPYYLEANCKSGSLECLISNVTAYTKYEVEVAVVLGKGYGPPSDVMTIDTPASLPGVPTKVSLVIEGSTTVVASWKPPTLPNGIISGYKYKFFKNVKDANVFTISGRNTFTKTFSKLDIDVDYHFEVAAENEIGIGPYSETISVRTGIDKPTEPPTQLEVSQITQTSAKLVWNRPKIRNNSDIYFSPKGYVITTVVKGKKRQFRTSDMYYKLTGLKPNTNYSYAIAAYITKFEGPTASITFTTLMAPPKAPKDLKAVRYFSTSVKLSWTAPPSQLGLKLSYELYQLAPGSPKLLLKTSETQCTVENLKPYTKYVFGVKTANKGSSKSAFSNDVSVLTQQDKPGFPFKVEVTDRWPTSSSVRVKWQPPTSPNGIITKYKITWRVSGQTSFKEEIYSKVRFDEMFFDIDHLTQETKYLFEVIAFTNVGNGPAKTTYYTTRYYPFGSEHIIIPFLQPKTAEKLSNEKAFGDNFIKIVQSITSIPKERFANVRLNTKLNAVEFELISNERRRETSNDILSEMDHVKALLAPSFDTSGGHDLTKPNSVESVERHAGQPSARKASSSSNTAAIVGIVCACAVIIAILIAALVIVFRRYRSTSMYNKFDSQVQYNNENTSHNVDGEVEVRRPSQNYRHKDIETVPLADADELT